jgi:putative ABC transport system permease protein
MTPWLWSLRELRRRPSRTLLTVAGIAVGVAILVAALTAVASARHAYRDLFDSTGGRPTLEVAASARSGFDPAAVDGLTTLPEVESAGSRVHATAALLTPDGATPAVVVGLGPPADAAFTPHEGRPFEPAAGAWLDRHSAAAHGWRPGATLRFWTPTGLAELPLLGTVAPRGPAGLSGGAVLYLPLATAQRLFALPGQVNGVELTLRDGADADAVGRAVAARLPPGLTVQGPGGHAASAEALLRAVEHGLAALGLIALVAAGFVVLNTVLLNVTERRGEFALLRALGAGSRQVRHLLLCEAALLGGAGALVGTAAGLGLALVLTDALQGFLGLALPRPRPAPLVLLAGLAAGPLLSVLAAWGAAWRAGRRPPLPDLVGARGVGGEVRASRGSVAAIVLLGAAGALVAGLALGRWPAPLAATLLAPGIAGLLAAAALCLPLVLPPLVRLGHGLLGALWPAEALLASRQLLGRPGRTGRSAAVLFLACAAAVAFGHYLLNSLADLHRWCGRAIVADYLVRGALPDSGFLLAAPLPETLGSDLEALAAVDHIDKIAFLPAQVNGRQALVLARTFRADRPPAVDLRAGEPARAWQGLLHGETVVGTALAARLSVGVGDSVSLQGRRGPVVLRVAGTATEYAGGGEALYLEWHTAQQLLPVPGVHAFLVSARPGQGAAVAAQLEAYCRGHGLLLQSNAELCGVIDGLLTRVAGALWLLVGLTLAVAALGVANTLTMNVVELAPELAVLRAAGMTTGQVRRLVLCQALLTGLAGLTPGAAAGVGLAALLTRLANVAFGQQAPFAISWTLIGGCWLAGLAIAALAAWLPARQAVRLVPGAFGTARRDLDFLPKRWADLPCPFGAKEQLWA